MKTGLIALNPRAAEGKSLQNFCAQLNHFQRHGLFEKYEIVSLINQHFFPLPTEVYNQTKSSLADEVRTSLAEGIGHSFDYGGIDVVEAPFANDEDLVDLLSKLAFKKRNQVLIFGVDTNQKIYKWLLGGVPETAALSAQAPILIVKVDEIDLPQSAEPTVLFAVDTSEPPSKRAYRRFCRIVKPLNAKVLLVTVSRQIGLLNGFFNFHENLEREKQIMVGIEAELRNLGISCQSEILSEDGSVASTISNYAEENKVWMTAVTSPPRDMTHRLFWGSTTQALLAETKSPLLVLRTK